MSARAVHLVIDARPRALHRLLAAEVILGKTVLGRLCDLVTDNAPTSEPIVVHARETSMKGSAIGRRREPPARCHRQWAASSGCHHLAD